MKKYLSLLLSVVAALSGTQGWAQTARISTVAIAPATGIVTLTERIGTAGNVPTSVSDSLAGLAYAENNVPLTGDLANSPVSVALYAITGRVITGGAQVDDFKGYGTIVAPNTSVATYTDVRNKFTAQAAFYSGGPNSYSGLFWLPVGDTFSLPGPNVFYTIHHRPSGDYFSVIVPGTSNTSDAYDLKPMSAAGVLTDPGATGYFALAYAAAAPAASYNANDVYFLRTAGAGDSFAPLHTVSIPSGHTVFGSMIPALTGGPTDRFDLITAKGSFGVTGYTTLTFSPDDLGDGVNQFYYLRQDSTGTGNTILGRLNPSLIAGVRVIQDIANLGAVFNTLTLARAATGPAAAWTTTSTLFTSGAPLPTGAQSVSFAAIADRTLIGDVPFIITPTASSGRDITVTVVSGPATVVNSGTGALRIATVTDTAAGVVTLRATIAAGGGFNANWLEQSYNVLGLPSITSAPTASATVGTPFTFNLTATGAPILSYTAVGLPASLTLNTVTGAITGTPLVAAIISVTGITATNATGTSTPATTLTITVVAAGVAPVITSSLAAAGTVGTAFSYAIVATGSPTSYSASPLPAGLAVNTATGAITGTPTTAGVTSVLLGATNGSGTGNATLTITIGAAGVAPVITSSLAAAGTVSTAFSYAIVATGSPTSYSASPLPAGLAINTATGAITGTPTTAGVTSVLLGATNGSGTGNATLTITIGAAGVAPVITSSLAAAGTAGTAFGYAIVATGSPTSYSASPLPAGLAVNTVTGAITGTPTTAGVTSVLLGATNGSGTGNATLTITIAAAAVPTTAPVISGGGPLTAAAVVGTPFSYSISATGSPTSYMASPLPAGLAINPSTGVISGTPTTVAITSVQLGATNSLGTGYTTLTITTTAALAAPIIVTQPSGQSVAAGQSTTFSVTAGADRDPTATYQWQRLPAGSTVWETLVEGGSYNGVKTSTLTVKAPSPASSGDQFRSVITNATSSTTSAAVALTVGAGTDAMFQYPASVALDATGNLYVADSFSNTIRKISPAGVVTTLAGSPGQAGSADGTDGSARFNQPGGVAVDSAGNVYVSDTGNATIRKITPAGAVTTLAGTANTRGSADGSGTAASFGSPAGLALDSSGNLYVADSFNATIRLVTPAGVVSTLAGSATNRGSANGTGSAARFNYPNGVTVDSAGNVYVADTYNNLIRKITPAGVVTSLAGLAGVSGADNGTGIQALFSQPYGVSVDAAGNVYVADTGNSTIRMVSPAGVVTTLAGVPGISGLENGVGSNALFNQPHGLVVVAGKVYVADTGNATIRVMASNNDVTTLGMSVTPAPTSNTPSTVPVSGPTTPASGGGSGGGGAPSTWFLGLLTLLAAARKWLKPASGIKLQHLSPLPVVALAALLVAPTPGSAQSAVGSIMLDATGTYTAGPSGATLTPGSPSFLTTLIADGIIANGAGAAALRSTAVTLTLTGLNTYTGGTYVDAGALTANSLTLPGNQHVTLTNGSPLTFSQPADGTFGGAISGSGSLVKTGAGALTLTGSNTYTGGTIVNGGTLIANTATLPANQGVAIASGATLAFNQTSDGTFAGNITGSGTIQKRGDAQLTLTRSTSSPVDLQAGWLYMNGGLGSTTIAANSSLGGTGTVSGNLANNGRLSPGYSPGTINVAGNYTQSATGTLVIQLASAASFDHLAVTGTAALAGGVQIDILGGYDVRGQSFTFLTADGGVSGKFSTQSGTAFATSMPTAAATVTYAANSVTFSIVQVPFAAFALTPNQTAVAVAAQADPALTGALNVIPQANQIPAALNALSPQDYQVWSDFGFAAATALADRLLQSGRMPTGCDDYYFEGGQRRGRARGDLDLGSSKYTDSSGLIGGNRAMNANTAVGAFFGFGKTISSLGSGEGSKTTVKNQTLGVRAAWTSGPMFAEAMLAYGMNSYDSIRAISFPGTSALASSYTHGHQWTTGLTAGQDLKYANLTVSPFAGLLMSRWQANSFTETGAGAFDATLGSQRAHSFRSQAGVEARYTLGIIQPHVRAAWLHEFSDNSRAMPASFGPTNTFALATRKAPRNTALYSAGVDVLIAPHALIYSEVSAQNGGTVKVLSEWRLGLSVSY